MANFVPAASSQCSHVDLFYSSSVPGHSLPVCCSDSAGGFLLPLTLSQPSRPDQNSLIMSLNSVQFCPSDSGGFKSCGWSCDITMLNRVTESHTESRCLSLLAFSLWGCAFHIHETITDYQHQALPAYSAFVFLCYWMYACVPSL